MGVVFLKTHARICCTRLANVYKCLFQAERTARLLFLWKMEVCLNIWFHNDNLFVPRVILRLYTKGKLFKWKTRLFNKRHGHTREKKELRLLERTTFRLFLQTPLERASGNSFLRCKMWFFLQAFEKKTELEKIRERNQKLVNNILPEHVADYFLQHQNKDETVGWMLRHFHIC